LLPNNKPYLIGETAFHHQGDIEFLKELIDEGAKLGVDAMKFHLLTDLDDYMTHDHEALEVLRPWCLGKSAWEEIINFLIEKRIEIILLCNDAESLNWIIEEKFPVQAIELHASGLNDFFLLEGAALFQGTVMLGVGGSTLDEIDYAINYLKAKGQTDLFLMHGFQNFPTDYKDINLSKMCLLRDLFELPIGYADHTDPADEDNETISVMAAALGFNVLEKHFTHHFGKKRIDAQAAVSIEQMKTVKRLLHKAFQVYGNNSLEMSDAEKKYGNTGPMKKAIVARNLIKKGEQLTLDHIAFKRTNESTYVKQLQMANLLGLEVKVDIQKDEQIDFSKVNYTFKKADISEFINTKK